MRVLDYLYFLLHPVLQLERVLLFLLALAPPAVPEIQLVRNLDYLLVLVHLSHLVVMVLDPLWLLAHLSLLLVLAERLLVIL